MKLNKNGHNDKLSYQYNLQKKHDKYFGKFLALGNTSDKLKIIYLNLLN